MKDAAKRKRDILKFTHEALGVALLHIVDREAMRFGLMAGDLMILALAPAIFALDQIQEGVRLDCLCCGHPFSKAFTVETQPKAFAVVCSERSEGKVCSGICHCCHAKSDAALKREAVEIRALWPDLRVLDVRPEHDVPC